jgi:predicted Fe-S protein YdhL (DUF1289 family)
MINEQTIKSPCVNICQLDADKVCLGCFRSLEEIGAWSLASEEERGQIVDRANAREGVDNG